MSISNKTMILWFKNVEKYTDIFYNIIVNIVRKPWWRGLNWPLFYERIHLFYFYFSPTDFKLKHLALSSVSVSDLKDFYSTCLRLCLCSSMLAFIDLFSHFHLSFFFKFFIREPLFLLYFLPPPGLSAPPSWSPVITLSLDHFIPPLLTPSVFVTVQ